MTLNEADAKFPGQTSGDLPPSPTRENPAAVYPKSSPQPAGAQNVPSNPRNVLSNPFAFQAALDKLHLALDEVISAIDNEAPSGVSEDAVGLGDKFKGWKNELDFIQGGKIRRDSSDLPNARVGATQEGGLFTD